MATNNVVPTVSPWRYWLTVFTSRAFALGLAGMDAVVSVNGMQKIGIPRAEALLAGAFILVVQASVAIALTSGQPVGESFQLRFFKDKGPLGAVKRILGYVLVVSIVLMYLVDILTNYAAFTDGQILPAGASQGIRASVAVVFAIGLTFGDELLHLFADENSGGASSNALAHAQAENAKTIELEYQKHYLKSAKDRANELGQQEGEQWRP